MDYLQFSDLQFRGKKIVSFVGTEAPIEPIETARLVKPLILDSDEYKKQQELTAKRGELMREQHELNLEFKKKYNPKLKKYTGPKHEESRIQTEFSKKAELIKELEIEIEENAKLIDQKTLELRHENSVCSAPRNSILLNKAESKSWRKKLNETNSNEFLLEDGTLITKKEFELDRISQLSEAEKQAEKKSRLVGAVAQASKMRGDWEIQGVPDALEKAQKWYEKEKQLIEERYA